MCCFNFSSLATSSASISKPSPLRLSFFNSDAYQQYRFQQFDEDMPPEDQLRWLCDNDIKYVVDNDDLERLTVLNDEVCRDRFRFMFDEKTVGRDDTRYRVSVHEFIGREECKK